MRGAALHFARRVASPESYAGLIVTDLMSLADLKALWGRRCPPTLLYFHENQISYPLAPGEILDYQYGFTNITTALAADRILFNSRTHRDVFLEGLGGFLAMMPEYRPRWVVDAIQSKSGVCYPGCHFSGGDAMMFDIAEKNEPPLVVWNHRWEFDKDPVAFFSALAEVERQGLDFRLALLGENFQIHPQAFVDAGERFKSKIVRFGYEHSRNTYQEWLRRGSVVVSTAIQENFGIAIIEAVRFGCVPLLPYRLVYPEIMPAAFHPRVLYRHEEEITAKLAWTIRNHSNLTPLREALSSAMKRYAWENIIDSFDRELEQLTVGKGASR